jgi:predicted ABC-type ATPase
VPHLIVLAGPNGAGKSTAAPALIRDLLGIRHFVNADTIARGLSGYDPESVSLAAGRIMLARLRELAARREDFAFETTLASRSFAPWIAGLREQGYVFHLRYLWIPSPELSVVRIEGRVRDGGHHVPGDIVRRRYLGGLANFFRLYRPIADDWEMFDNSDQPRRLIAHGRRLEDEWVYDRETWDLVRSTAEDG